MAVVAAVEGYERKPGFTQLFSENEMEDNDDIDSLLADRVREFELGLLHRGQLDSDQRELRLTEILGPQCPPKSGEKFSIGDAVAGVSTMSAWYQFRRIHFAVITSIAVGELRQNKQIAYCIDINCTLSRSLRINVSTMSETDNFLVALHQLMQLKIVPTIEDEMHEQRQREEAEIMRLVDANRRHQRMELLAKQQNQLLATLIQVECAPRVSFGVIF